ncbi:MAG TPA: hypothetical protein VN901_02080 [Candidatus Acidoferrales bacterium]|nr:hypothetical protein [Candidatus Acidoferrales bacterium]
MPHLKVSGKGEKTRYVPLQGVAQDLIAEYLKKAGHGADNAGRCFVHCATVEAVGKRQLRPLAHTNW